MLKQATSWHLANTYHKIKCQGQLPTRSPTTTPIMSHVQSLKKNTKTHILPRSTHSFFLSNSSSIQIYPYLAQNYQIFHVLHKIYLCLAEIYHLYLFVCVHASSSRSPHLSRHIGMFLPHFPISQNLSNLES